MAKLAINGGKPVRGRKAGWPQWPQHGATEVKLLKKIAESNRWSYDGPYEAKFANAFNKYHKSKYGLCCANGTVGIQLALEALDVGAGDEVIVPGLTWQATAAAVLDVNAIPILTDVEPDTWCISVDAIEANITRKTKAVIVVHLYGCMPDMTKIRALCKKRGLYLIEDCAHQHGAFWKGKGVGTLGDISSFSFQESKVLSAGEGGYNMTQNKVLMERLYSLRNCGRGLDDDMTNAVQSGNYRITEFQAAMLIGGLERLDKQVKLRDANAQYLNKRLAEIPGVEPMRRRKEITQASYFNFAFRVNWDEIGKRGLTNAHFSAALAVEVYAGLEPPYEPLNKCELYKPHTKRRHKISREYWKAINPRRFKLPVCKEAHEKTGIAIHHHILLGTRKDMDAIADAAAKVVENIDEVSKDAPQTLRKKHRALAV